MAPRAAPRRLVLACVAACLALFAAAAAAQLGHVPRYFDTLEYARRARSFEVDAFRGFAYPALIAAAHRAAGEPGVREPFRWSRRAGHPDAPHAAGVYTALQLAQLAAVAAAVATFARVATGLGGAALALVAALVALDPIVAHFSLSILTDALALAASLAFCAALGELGARRPRAPAAAWALLPAAAFAATGLRPEKGPVLVAAALASAGLLWLVARRSGGDAVAGPRRVAAALALVLAAVGAGAGVQRALAAESPRWGPLETALALRVILPGVGELASLPPSAQEALGPDAARLARAPLPRAHAIVERASGGDPERREALLRGLAEQVLRERGGALALDAAKDAAENLAATPSFYARLALALAPGRLARAAGARDGAAWTFTVLAGPGRGLAAAALLAAALLAILASAAALAAARARRRAGAAWLAPEAAVAWAPAAAFCAANAVAFALAQDLVHVRYALAAHACFLVAVYAALLRYGLAVAGAPGAAGFAATAAGGGASPGAEVGR